MHHLGLLFLLSLATIPAAPAGDGGGGCNRRCNSFVVPYPFGFSGNCPILLLCNAGTSTALLPHSTAAAAYPILSFNSTASTFLATVPPSYNRNVRDAEASLTGPGYGVSSRTGLFLRGGGSCHVPPNSGGVNCTVAADLMTTVLRTAQCGGNDTSWTCVSALSGAPAPVLNGAAGPSAGPGHQLEFLPWVMVSASGCREALTAMGYGVDTVQGLPSLQFGVAELGWWLNGTCAATGRASCAPNATCHNVETPTGALGHRCTCQYGMIGDGYAAGDGCHHDAEPASSSERGLPAAVGAGVFSAFLLSIGLAVWFLWRRRNLQKRTAKQGHKPARLFRGEPVEDDFEQGETGPRQFIYDDLVAATGSFSDDRRLGKGGFGSVYEGFLTDTNRYVAVKRAAATSQQGWKEFAAEVRIISQLRHRNLVQLIGWCHGGDDELLLVYELLPNGSLDAHLYNKLAPLTWAVRYGIALGVGSALL